MTIGEIVGHDVTGESGACPGVTVAVDEYQGNMQDSQSSVIPLSVYVHVLFVASVEL